MYEKESVTVKTVSIEQVHLEMVISQEKFEALQNALKVYCTSRPAADLLAMIKQAEPLRCQRCGSLLSEKGYCTDETCPHYDHLQNETWTEG